jgi:EAL domain-containing protein (putative c-di-GMP-specific phosphodiesterase class I)
VSQVLLVEDDPIVRQAYSKVLRRGGLGLETAEDGIEALEKVRGGCFDAVVSDINMPRLSGIEFLRALREQELDVPVVLVTGGPALETAVSAVEYGAFRYLTKPVDIEALLETVLRAVAFGTLQRRRREGAADDAPAVHVDLDGSLAKLWVAFQPIVSWSGRAVVGYEALARSEGALASPGVLVAAAEGAGRLRELGRAGRARVADAAAQAPPGALIFVNLHASDLEDEHLVDPAAPLAAHAARVVLEITERAALDGVQGVPERLAALRRLGYRVAVDDLGAGYAGLASFPALQPEVVKLDMALVRNVDQSPLQQRVIRSVVELGRELRMMVVSEGIETPAERDALAALGCDVFQGYLFARPARGFPPVTF